MSMQMETTGSDFMTRQDAEDTVSAVLQYVNNAKITIEIYLNSVIDKDEKDDFLLKTDFNPRAMTFTVSLYNTATKTIVVKAYNLSSMFQLSKNNVLNEALREDVTKLYIASKKKLYKEDTTVYVS